MKLITAIIRPESLDMVRQALIAADITRITVSRCTGHGRASEDTDLYRGQEITPDLVSKVRLDIAVNDEFVDVTIKAISDVARTGKIGDGKIIVSPIDNIYRISSGENGSEAI